MSEYDNTNRGALFPNKDKKTASHPDYKGTIGDQHGDEYWASAWIKEPKGGGQKYLSIALTLKDGNATTGKAVNRETNSSDAEDFLTSNAAKIEQHKTRNASAAQPASPPAPDFDSFDEKIPF